MDYRNAEALANMLYTSHPWHGISPGEEAPEVVTAFIEIVPTDTVKYELDKPSGLLRIDRPQRFSSMCPTLYGLIPQTYCGEKIGKFCEKKAGLKDIIGDGDPIDICVLTERTITSGNILIKARPIGGMRMIDNGSADDKIVAVLDGDLVYGKLENINQVPEGLIDRLRHYFLSYKQLPTEASRNVQITHVYDRAEALEVIKASMEDYDDKYASRRRALEGAV